MNHSRQQVASLALGLLCGLLGAGLAVQSPAHAAGSSCSSKNNYFAGVQKSTYDTDVYGVRANIEYRDPALCSASGGSPSSSAAWAMLIPKTPLTQYAQSGYVKVGSDSPDYPNHTGTHNFGQFTYACAPNCSDGHNAGTYWGAAPSGSTMYKTYLRASDDRIVMYAGSDYLGKVTRDVTGEWNTAWSGQFSGETFHPQSDVPGVASQKVQFNYIQKYAANGDIDFIQNLGAPFIDVNRYNVTTYDASVGGKGLNLWTDPL